MSSALNWQNSKPTAHINATFSTGHWTSLRVKYIKHFCLNSVRKMNKIYKEQRRKILDAGRQIRIQNLQDFRDNIPKIQEIFEGNYLNLEKWFFAYKKLMDFGARRFKGIRIENNKLVLTYTNYAKGQIKDFTTILPRRINMDEDFQYFFGLWIGDKAGGGRFGVMNKDKVLNFYTAEYLKKLYQNPEFVLHIHNDKIPQLDYKIDKIVKIKSLRNGYAISVHVINGILKTFFEYLASDLDRFLYLIPNKNIFFAGLFDAEGNVFLEDGCFRWSCLNEKQVEIYKQHLTELELFRRYDGDSLIGYNLDRFSQLIFPYLKHPKKINALNLLYYGTGSLEKRFIDILGLVGQKPGISNAALAKALNKAKVYSQVRFLERQGHLASRGYPKQLYLTNKSLAVPARGTRIQ